MKKLYIICGGVAILFLCVGIFLSSDFFRDIKIRSKYADQKDFEIIFPSIQENYDFVEKNPRNDSAYYSLGQTFYNLKGYDDSISTLKKAVDIAPATYYYWGFLGKVYQAKKDYTSARDAYIKTLELKDDKPEHYLQLAWLYYFRLETEKDKTYEILKRGLEKFPKDKDMLFDITRFYLYDENETEFRKYAPRYLAIDPNNELIKPAYEQRLHFK